VRFYVSTATFFLLHCDEWDRVVALPRHKFVTGATLLQLGYYVPDEGYYVPDDGYYVPDEGYYVPDEGYYVPDEGYYVPDDGY
jgi:hypothetical protein